MEQKTGKRRLVAADTWGAVFRRLQALFKRVRSQAFWAHLIEPRSVWRALGAVVGWLHMASVRLPWLVAILVVAIILIQGLTQHATVIDPISVPRELADKGYTADVAGQRLRDAMTDYMRAANTHMSMSQAELAMRGDLPKIVVPGAGISLDAVIASLRTLLRGTRTKTVTGEIIEQDKLFWLRLRLDGQQIYTSPVGVALNRPDELFTPAVPAVLKEIRPYFVAVVLRRQDPDAAMKYVDEMIAKLSAGDDELPWLYNTRGLLLRRLKNYEAAAEALKTAIRLNPSLTIAHINLASVYMDMHRTDDSLAQDREALRLEPNYAIAHSNYGDHLRMAGKFAEARAEVDKALAIDKNLAYGYDTLGDINRDTGKRDEAIAAYKQALTLDPKLAHSQQELDKLVPPQAADNAGAQK